VLYVFLSITFLRLSLKCNAAHCDKQSVWWSNSYHVKIITEINKLQLRVLGRLKHIFLMDQGVTQSEVV